MDQILTDANPAGDLRDRGLKCVLTFSWRRSAEQMSRLPDEGAGGAASAAPSPQPWRLRMI